MAKVDVVLTSDTKQRIRRVDPKLAGYLIAKGKARYATKAGGALARLLSTVGDVVEAVSEPEQPEATEAPSDDLGGKSYRELIDMAREAGVVPEGRTKDDYLRALRYRTRDMRAED